MNRDWGAVTDGCAERGRGAPVHVSVRLRSDAGHSACGSFSRSLTTARRIAVSLPHIVKTRRDKAHAVPNCFDKPCSGGDTEEDHHVPTPFMGGAFQSVTGEPGTGSADRGANT